MEAGFLSAKRCGRTRRVRINGAVRLVVISVAIAVSLEVAGSVKEMVHDANVDEDCVDGWEGGNDFGDLGREGLEVGHVKLDGLLAWYTREGRRGFAFDIQDESRGLEAPFAVQRGGLAGDR